MLSFDVDQSLVPVAHRWSRSFLTKLAKACDLQLKGQARGQVEVSFVSDADIRRLNRMYRHTDKITDVLSFPATAPNPSGNLGEILIAYDQAVRQAEDEDIELELADLLVHGLLHLMGYDHEIAGEAEVMFTLQDKLVAAIL